MLKFMMEKYEQALVFQVLQEDEDIVEQLLDHGSYIHENGWVLDMSPYGSRIKAPTKKKVSIWELPKEGEIVKDFHIATISFDSNFDRDEAYEEIIDLFDEFFSMEHERNPRLGMFRYEIQRGFE